MKRGRILVVDFSWRMEQWMKSQMEEGGFWLLIFLEDGRVVDFSWRISVEFLWRLEGRIVKDGKHNAWRLGFYEVVYQGHDTLHIDRCDSQLQFKDYMWAKLCMEDTTLVTIVDQVHDWPHRRILSPRFWPIDVYPIHCLP